jgi:hypothetical protein
MTLQQFAEHKQLNEEQFAQLQTDVAHYADLVVDFILKNPDLFND